MTISESELAPRIYHLNDPDEIFQLWKDIVSSFATTERTQAQLFQEIVDPDTCPSNFVNILLRHLGNPFVNITLTETQKRKLVKFLLPIYKQKGTEVGIVNAIRFLTGLEVDLIDPHGVDEDSWQVGLSEIGSNSYVGGEAVYCNLLSWSEDLTMSEWDKTDVTVDPDAIAGPAPWYRDADTVTMDAITSVVSQTVEPIFVGNEDFSGQVYLKAAAASVVTLAIYATDDPTDITTVDVNVTTDWQKFEIQHQMEPLQTSPRVTFSISSPGGAVGDIYIFGAQMVRNNDFQPYQMTEADAEDCYNTGRWAYHFIIVVSEVITSTEEAIIRSIADYMKPAHTHYTLITPDDETSEDIIDHWELGLSEVGISTFVHSGA